MERPRRFTRDFAALFLGLGLLLWPAAGLLTTRSGARA
jgi:hypothetical protein